MISKAAITSLHASMHESLGLVIDHASGLPADLLTTEVAGFGYPTVMKQLVHVLTCERGWVLDLQIRPYEGQQPGAFRTIDTIREFRKDTTAKTIAYLDSLTERELNTELERYPDEWLGPRRAPAFILLHVITHAFHHKGQIVAMFRLLGYPAPDTDMQRAQDSQA